MRAEARRACGPSETRTAPRAGRATAPAGSPRPAVFTYTPGTIDPTFVALSLRFPAEDGDEGITISDGAALRNYFEAS